MLPCQTVPRRVRTQKPKSKRPHSPHACRNARRSISGTPSARRAISVIAYRAGFEMWGIASCSGPGPGPANRSRRFALEEPRGGILPSSINGSFQETRLVNSSLPKRKLLLCSLELTSSNKEDALMILKHADFYTALKRAKAGSRLTSILRKDPERGSGRAVSV